MSRCQKIPKSHSKRCIELRSEPGAPLDGPVLRARPLTGGRVDSTGAYAHETPG